MEQFSAELVWDAKAELGEGPCWDARAQVLWWVDIGAGSLYRYTPAEGTNEVFSFDQPVTAAVPRQSGGLIISFPHGIAAFDPDRKETQVLVDGVESDRPNNRFNDGKCDAFGRLWIGTLSKSGAKGEAQLYVLDPNLQLREAFGPVSCSNGMAWSPDGRTLFYIDTPTRQVAAFDYDAESGTIRNRRVAVEIPEGEGFPDGMTIDREGMLWVAHWGGARVSRWDPASGRQLGVVKVPAEQVTSCAFGGPGGDELYITTAREGLREEQLAQFPLAGGLFRVRPGFSGEPALAFGG